MQKYAKDILKIAFPIMLGNIGFIMIGVGDVVDDVDDTVYNAIIKYIITTF